MANVSQIEQYLKLVLETRASTLARERGFIKRQRKWSRADLIRPRLSDRKAFEAIVYVLRTGIQWDALPRELGASSTKWGSRWRPSKLVHTNYHVTREAI